DHHFSKSVDYLQKNRGWSADASLVFDELNTEKENIGLLEKIQTLKSVKEIDSHYITLGKLTGGFKQIDKDLISRSYKRTQGYKQFVSENDMIRAVLYLGSRNTKEVLEVYKKVGDICKDKCSLVGDNIILAQLSKKVPDILMKSFLISVVLVLLVILSLAYFKKSKNILAIVVSSLWGPLIIIGAISVFQIPLNHMSCVFIGVLIGLTGDNAIQYIWASDKSLEEGINEKAKGSIQIMLFMILASLIFQLAYFVPPRKLGMLLCFGYFSSLIGDLWILKSLITKNKD
ncbi:MAG: hypothetical protein ACI9QD_000465, partial [Thermoproteota archaeon]